MTANLRVVSTQAETDLEAHFAALKDGGADLISLREAAFARFRATGLPHRRIEEWKYTDLRAFLKSYAAPAAAASWTRSRLPLRVPRPMQSWSACASCSPTGVLWPKCLILRSWKRLALRFQTSMTL
ncbi:hypothetical protein V6L77_24745 [Pannonibacter sp. Pt2-lr]